MDDGSGFDSFRVPLCWIYIRCELPSVTQSGLLGVQEMVYGS